MRFEFATSQRIVFGEGAARGLADAARALLPGISQSRRVAFVVTGAHRDRYDELLATFDAAGFDLAFAQASGEPTVATAREATLLCRERNASLVLAIGGGSALDLGKAVAALAGNTPADTSPEPLDFLEVVGRGRPLAQPSLPFIAVPTTSGTGAEVTRNAVLLDEATRVKASLRSEHMLPRLALVDPELTYSAPPAVTAATGMDALTQVLEPFVSPAATPITDALAREVLPRAPAALRRAFACGDDATARRDLSLLSLFGGLSLANAKLGAVHGFAAPLGGVLGAPHGAICARLLPEVIEVNLAALRARAPEHPSLERYAQVARMLGGDSTLIADDAVTITRALAVELGVAPLSRYGLDSSNLESIAAAAAKASSMRGNPVELTAAERVAILERAL
ncbi:MAG: iron-containing alcohol dehydrogenase [Polyangiaceae bacterium]